MNYSAIELPSIRVLSRMPVTQPPILWKMTCLYVQAHTESHSPPDRPDMSMPYQAGGSPFICRPYSGDARRRFLFRLAVLFLIFPVPAPVKHLQRFLPLFDGITVLFAYPMDLFVFRPYQFVAMSICVGFEYIKSPVSATIHVPRELSTRLPLGLRFRSAAHMIYCPSIFAPSSRTQYGYSSSEKPARRMIFTTPLILRL